MKLKQKNIYINHWANFNWSMIAANPPIFREASVKLDAVRRQMSFVWEIKDK